MIRAVVTSCLMLVFALLIGCPPAQPAFDPRGAQKGDIPLTIVNKTHAVINNVNVATDTGKKYSTVDFVSLIFEGDPKYPVIKPGEEREFRLKAGKKQLTVKDHPGDMSNPRTKILEDYPIDLEGPTQVVVYDDDPPPVVTAPGGVTQVVVQGIDAQKAKQRAADDAAYAKTKQDIRQRSAAELQKCQSLVPPKGERPAPGRAKVDGKWTCILSGGASGTDYVALVQLAGGNISGTVTGFDRNATWEGSIVGDEVHFRFPQVDAGGGKLKVDPGGRAMKGPMWIYANDGFCVNITMTCTR